MARLNDAKPEEWDNVIPDSQRGGTRPFDSALDRQIDGKHYQHMAIQPAEFAEKNCLGFLEGNVVKYVSRHWQKGGADDLRKAIHCLEMLVELRYED